MRSMILIFLVVLCITCIYTGMPASPAFIPVAVSNSEVSDLELSRVGALMDNTYVGEMRMVDSSKDRAGPTRVEDGGRKKQFDFPQFGRFF